MVRRGPVLLALALACAPALAACSLLLGEGFTDSDGDPVGDTRSSTDGSARTDADGMLESDGGPTGGDGSPNPPNDGSPGTDSGNPLPDGGFVCPAGTARFCDDFQRDEVQGSWDAVHIGTGGSLVIAKPPGASRRLESAVTALGGIAQLSKSFNLTPQKVHFELTVTIGSFSSAGGVYITGLFMQNGSNAPALLYLYVNQSGTFFVEQVADGVAYVGSSVPLTPGTAHRVVIDVALGGKTVVAVDGAKKVDKNTETFLYARPPTVYLGAASLDGQGNGVALKIDDFVFTAD